MQKKHHPFPDFATQHQSPQVKCCGITNLADAKLAAELGYSAIGMVFYPNSEVDMSTKLDQVKQIIKQLQLQLQKQATNCIPTTVAVFSNPSKDLVNSCIDCGFDLLQFHSEESQEFCESFNLPYLKGCAIKHDNQYQQTCQAHPQAIAILCDSYQLDKPGGTGKTFNWDLLKQLDATNKPKPLLLAGGLSANNIVEAAKQVSPDGYDISSGLASTQNPRKKDPQKMTALITNINHYIINSNV